MPPDRSLPPPFNNLDYDAYRDIRFRTQHALWRGDALPFQIQFFHRGWVAKDRVTIYVVSDGVARQVQYSPSLFTYGRTPAPPANTDLGFAGFRLHAKINRPDYYDEVGAFLGASYFRAVARGQGYGISARGLSIGTGSPHEEFPAFRTFWIEKPEPDNSALVVHALLDSESSTGAFRFTIRPGETTTYDTKLVLYPRKDVGKAGIGTGTSMFFFGPNDRLDVDDFRPAVHDSDGLALHSGHQEEFWRPLKNPAKLCLSVFADKSPRGFGLMQRERQFSSYDDLESHFEKRPSLWVEPVGDWGEGSVELVEIPAKKEIDDNIVAFWRPKQTLKAGGEYPFDYRLYWTSDRPRPANLARFTATRVGESRAGRRLFVLELTGGSLLPWEAKAMEAAVKADKGTIHNVVLHQNPETGGARLSFELDTKGESLIELRGLVRRNEVPISETWLYQWTPQSAQRRG